MYQKYVCEYVCICMYVCMYDPCYFPEYPHSAPPPPFPLPSLGSQPKKIPLVFAHFVFVCQLVCVFKYSLFYDFDLMMTATLRIYKKIQLSCIFGYCFIAVTLVERGPRLEGNSHPCEARNLTLSFEYSLRLI